jgi:hypothetical protein
MKPYINTYYKFFDYTIGDYIPDEVDGTIASDIHHITARSQGKIYLNCIENLMALNRENHSHFGDKKLYMMMLYHKHLRFIHTKRPDYNINFENIPLAYRTECIEFYNNLL